MAFETPGHAMRLCMINHWHVVDGAVTAKTTDAAVDVRAVIVKNVVGRAMDLHPLDWVARFPAGAHRLELWIILLHLRMAVHARLGIGHIRVRRHLNKAVTVTAIHSQLRHVHIMRKRHRLNRLIPHPGVLWRHVIPCGCGQPTDRQDPANHQFDRHPVGPAWKKICHGYLADPDCTNR